VGSGALEIGHSLLERETPAVGREIPLPDSGVERIVDGVRAGDRGQHRKPEILSSGGIFIRFWLRLWTRSRCAHCTSRWRVPQRAVSKD
jgi:hypothetical protein